jgi:hypothetical protein
LRGIRQAPEFVQFMAEMKAQYERYRRGVHIRGFHAALRRRVG